MTASTAAAAPLGPLDPERGELLRRVLDGLEPDALHWLSGFAAGVAYARAPSAGFVPAVLAPAAATPAVVSRPEATARLAIVYGSQTGNGRRIAERLGRAAEAVGLAARVYAARDYPLRDLAQERLLSVVVSTHGDGDPPDDARGFIEYLTGRRAPQLPNLRFSVLALGDSSYPKFCETGRQVDERLAALGAERLLPRVDCDVDVERLAAPWLDEVVGRGRETLGAAAIASNVTRLHRVPEAARYGREQPFDALVLANDRITGRGAAREVRHLEISLAGSGLEYRPGDALGVWHENPGPVVDAVLGAIGARAATPVTVDGQARSLGEWLACAREITRLTRPFLAAHAGRARSEELAAVLAPGGDARLREVLRTLQLVDVLRRWPAAWEPEAFVGALRPLAPRLYSIASSMSAVGEEAHLTVAVVDYESGGERRFGAASAHLAGLTGDEARVRVFVEPNERFRLPEDPSRDVIMIGPGTGVAPYRGFLQERAAQGASGRNWLVFGNRHFGSEFLYQVEWQEAARKGLLQRVDLAFSRDRKPRAYVQDRLREAGAELWSWLEGGAHLYVCGDAERMAPDVHAALVEIAMQHGGLEHDGAEAHLRRLADDRRYLRDVY